MRNQQQTTDMLSFVIIPKMFWRNLTKIGKIYIPYEFAQVVVFLTKSNTRF